MANIKQIKASNGTAYDIDAAYLGGTAAKNIVTCDVDDMTVEYGGSISSTSWLYAVDPDNIKKIRGIAPSNVTAGNVSGTVAVAHGGTGATTAANARSNLGIGASGTHANDYYLIKGSTTNVQLANGSTKTVQSLYEDIIALFEDGNTSSY